MRNGAVVVGLLGMALTLTACATGTITSTTTTASASNKAVSTAAAAPATAAGYAAAFAALPPAQWGAADVAITVPLGEHVVWLFGDTFSTSRFVHSSAVVQAGGAFNVSDDGAQLLPNDDPAHIYWIDCAHARGPDTLLITARSITLTGAGPWDFHDGGFDRTARVTVDAHDDLTFTGWVGAKHYCPAPEPGRMIVYGPHHFGYAVHTHPELELADGAVLVTTCQNWDDGILHPVADYRPIFSESRQRQRRP